MKPIEYLLETPQFDGAKDDNNYHAQEHDHHLPGVRVDYRFYSTLRGMRVIITVYKKGF